MQMASAMYLALLGLRLRRAGHSYGPLPPPFLPPWRPPDPPPHPLLSLADLKCQCKCRGVLRLQLCGVGAILCQSIQHSGTVQHLVAVDSQVMSGAPCMYSWLQLITVGYSWLQLLHLDSQVMSGAPCMYPLSIRCKTMSNQNHDMQTAVREGVKSFL